MFDGKKILITGGTGSLGFALTKRLIETDIHTIRIFSRDESKQVLKEMPGSDQHSVNDLGEIQLFPQR